MSTLLFKFICFSIICNTIMCLYIIFMRIMFVYTCITSFFCMLKKRPIIRWNVFYLNRQCPIFPGSFPPSIFGAGELNFCVRDGYRWILPAIITGSFLYSFYLKLKRKTISSSTFDHLWLSVRSISIGQLHTLLHLHLRPINQLVFLGSSTYVRRSILVGGFALRCFQRLSRPYLATRLCSWHCNRCTSGMSTPVLSY